MTPIEEFEGIRNRVKDKVLLLSSYGRMVGPRYMLALYDANRDVYNAINGPFMNAEESPYEEETVNTCIGELHCVMPHAFRIPTGERKFSSYMLLEDVISDIVKMDMFSDDVEKLLTESSSTDCYLVITRDWKLCISETGNFVSTGLQLTMCTPDNMNGSIYHGIGSMPRDMVRYAVNLNDWERLSKFRKADIDDLYGEFCKLDLGNKPQKEITGILRECMEKHVRKEM